MSRSYLARFHRGETETQRGKSILQVGKRAQSPVGQVISWSGVPTVVCANVKAAEVDMRWDVCKMLTLLEMLPHPFGQYIGIPQSPRGHTLV